MTLFGLWGIGGFGREVMPLLRHQELLNLSNDFEIVYVVDGVPATKEVQGFRVMSDLEFLDTKCDRYFNIAISESKVRRRIAERAIKAGCQPKSIIASDVYCHESNRIDEASILCGRVTITADAKIGRFFHANIYSYVAHDCIVGDFVTFAPRVSCNGRVIVEDDVYIGTNAVIRHGTETKPIIIGKGAVVGMGAVVTKDVAPYTTVVGNPARPK